MAGSVSDLGPTLRSGLLCSSGRAKCFAVAALLVFFSGLSATAQESPPALDPQPPQSDEADAESAPEPFSDPVDVPPSADGYDPSDPFRDSQPPAGDERPPALPPAPNYADAVKQTREIVVNLQNAVRLANDLNTMLTTGDPTAANGHAVAAGRPVAANGVPMARKVHAIIVADDRQTSGGVQNLIAVGAASNANMMSELLGLECSVITGPAGANILENNIVLDKADFDFRKFRSTLNSIQVADDDVLFVYFACHGLTFVDSDNAHGFQMPGFVTGRERTPRRAVWDLMKAKGARQTILISDSCANGVREVAPEAEAFAAATTTHALAALLLFNTGDVDINGCSRPPEDHGDGRGRGEFGIYDPRGGFFTVAFHHAALHAPRPISWKRLFMVETQGRLTSKFPVNVQGIGRVSKQTIQRIDD